MLGFLLFSAEKRRRMFKLQLKFYVSLAVVGQRLAAKIQVAQPSVQTSAYGLLQVNVAANRRVNWPSQKRNLNGARGIAKSAQVVSRGGFCVLRKMRSIGHSAVFKPVTYTHMLTAPSKPWTGLERH